jgi:hypothetical protein
MVGTTAAGTDEDRKAAVGDVGSCLGNADGATKRKNDDDAGKASKNKKRKT